VVAEVQATADSSPLAMPGGVEICWTDQEVPFHASARATLSDPAAVQAVAEVQDTPGSAPLIWGSGSGTCWTDQAVPFHCSAAGAVMAEGW